MAARAPARPAGLLVLLAPRPPLLLAPGWLSGVSFVGLRLDMAPDFPCCLDIAGPLLSSAGSELRRGGTRARPRVARAARGRRVALAGLGSAAWQVSPCALAGLGSAAWQVSQCALLEYYYILDAFESFFLFYFILTVTN